MTISDYLPDDSDSDGDGRTGLLSTRVEWHALTIGFSVGMHTAASGDVQAVGDVLGLIALGSRAQKGIPEKYKEQVMSELPYFIAGVVLGYVTFTYGPQVGSSALIPF